MPWRVLVLHFTCFPCVATAQAVFETLARESNLFRVPIIDEDRQMFNLVTQSQVIAWLHGNKDKLGTIVVRFGPVAALQSCNCCRTRH